MNTINNIITNTKRLFEGKSYARLLIGLGILLVAWVIFAAGIFVGYHKATFSRDWDDMHQNGILDDNSVLAPFMHNPDDVNPHGAMGEIISSHFPVIMIKGPQNAEQIIVISSTTMIRLFHGMASTSAIQTGQFAIVVGEPDTKGEIQASFIRIVPPPPFPATTTNQ